MPLLFDRNLPFKAAEWQELKDLLLAFNPIAEEKLVKSRAAIPKLLDASFLHQSKLKELFRSTPTKIHFAFDIWKSPNNKSLFACVAHFFNGVEFKLQKVLLGLPEVSRHTGEAIRDAFFKVIEQYNILDYLGYACSDNISANDRGMRLISERLKAEFDIKWEPITHRIRCLGHILNLSVRAFLFTRDNEAIAEAARILNFNAEKLEEYFTAHTLSDSGWASSTALAKLAVRRQKPFSQTPKSCTPLRRRLGSI